MRFYTAQHASTVGSTYTRTRWPRASSTRRAGSWSSAYPSHREGVISHFAGDPMVQANAALDLSLLDHYDKMLVELAAPRSARARSGALRPVARCV